MTYLIICSVLCSLFINPLAARAVLGGYIQNRAELIEAESLQSLGGKLQLNEKEQLVNSIIMQMKLKEVDYSFENPQYFNFSRHFFEYKDEMKNSKVRQIIKKMPKGGALHIHSSLMLGADYLMELTYEDHLYACLTDDDLQLHFSETNPLRPCPVKWALLSELRDAADDEDEFNANLRNYFTLDAHDNITLDTDINEVWKKFNKVYFTIKSLTSYRPVREKAFYQSLQSFYDDNVMYVEIRTGLSKLYELNGTQHSKLYMATFYNEIAEQFKKDNPDFIGVKLIVTTVRSANDEKIREILDFARAVKEELPDMFAGFDLVGQEDLGRPLIEFVPALIEAKNDINYYFHGGETNWYGTKTDENLYDAILLGTKRIGHAYALLKHPTLIAAVAQRDIALEVNVISNSVLSLVKNMRNHPLATYLALGLPVVLSSDDPGVWDADPLTDDFYVAFVAIASKRADLRMLKQLAINSIRYSALDDKGKTRLFRVFEQKWDEFIDYVIDTYR